MSVSTVNTTSKYANLKRTELIEAAKAAGYDRPANAKSQDLIDYLDENASVNGAAKQKDESPRTATLRAQYAQCRKDIQTAIVNNQATRAAYKETPNEETKAAYESTKLAHKQAVARIKEVRPAFKQSQIDDDAETTSFEAEVA